MAGTSPEFLPSSSRRSPTGYWYYCSGRSPSCQAAPSCPA
ncbi:hypothetical protein CDS [Bradyrhizobium sp.]|nr:hypothetical protein CDS [Bradyrhizobium sp.]